MKVKRPYIAEVEIRPGRGVVQGSAENKVKLPSVNGEGDFIGVYPFEANMTHDAGDELGIALLGVVKVEAGNTVNAGKKAVLAEGGRFIEAEETDGTYNTFGTFLESGSAGEYVDMLIERGTFVAGTEA